MCQWVSPIWYTYRFSSEVKHYEFWFLHKSLGCNMIIISSEKYALRKSKVNPLLMFHNLKTRKPLLLFFQSYDQSHDLSLQKGKVIFLDLDRNLCSPCQTLQGHQKNFLMFHVSAEALCSYMEWFHVNWSCSYSDKLVLGG